MAVEHGQVIGMKHSFALAVSVICGAIPGGADDW